MKLKDNNPGRMLANGAMVAIGLRWLALAALVTLSLIAMLLFGYLWLQAMPTEFFVYDMMIYRDRCSVSYQVRDGDAKRFDICDQRVTNPTTGELVWSWK